VGAAPPEVAPAIVGASRPEQIHANAKASGIDLSPDALAAIDEALRDAPVKQPTLAPAAQTGGLAPLSWPGVEMGTRQS
jgi:diketogulonate reductase-like aldo/keto reductase